MVSLVYDWLERRSCNGVVAVLITTPGIFFLSRFLLHFTLVASQAFQLTLFLIIISIFYAMNLVFV